MREDQCQVNLIFTSDRIASHSGREKAINAIYQSIIIFSVPFGILINKQKKVVQICAATTFCLITLNSPAHPDFPFLIPPKKQRSKTEQKQKQKNRKKKKKKKATLAGYTGCIYTEFGCRWQQKR